MKLAVHSTKWTTNFANLTSIGTDRDSSLRFGMTRREMLPLRTQEQFLFYFRLLRAALPAMLMRGLDEFPKQRMRLEWFRFELGMELAS